jgi:hypothetical protein
VNRLRLYHFYVNLNDFYFLGDALKDVVVTLLIDFCDLVGVNGFFFLWSFSNAFFLYFISFSNLIWLIEYLFLGLDRSLFLYNSNYIISISFYSALFYNDSSIFAFCFIGDFIILEYLFFFTDVLLLLLLSLYSVKYRLCISLLLISNKTSF